MNPPNRSIRVAGLLTAALAAGAGALLASDLPAAQPSATQPQSIAAPASFASPQDAVKALQAAAADKDQFAALLAIFGPEFRGLLTGDRVQDANHARRFATALSQNCSPVKEGDDEVTFAIGTNSWPMPIPLVKADGHWHFDTAAGKEEIVSRHIGKDELQAIGVCRAFVAAQQQYAAATRTAGGSAKYAQRFTSTPGTKDGLYWPSAANETASPFGPLMAKARAEGYVQDAGPGLLTLHGYRFKILTRQGQAAPGGVKDYVNHGDLTAGFALVAYPEQWDRSGIMTFVINQDGKLFQRNLGEGTARIAWTMTDYNPDADWSPVMAEDIKDAGVLK